MSDVIVIVHWPGKDTPACPEHLRQLVGLAAVMGFALSWSPTMNPELKCSNCETQRAKG